LTKYFSEIFTRLIPDRIAYCCCRFRRNDLLLHIHWSW